MTPTVRTVGINNPEQAKHLSDMITKAKRKIVQRDPEKARFIEVAQRKEAEFLAEGFDQA